MTALRAAAGFILAATRHALNFPATPMRERTMYRKSSLNPRRGILLPFSYPKGAQKPVPCKYRRHREEIRRSMTTAATGDRGTIVSSVFGSQYSG